MHKYLQNKYYKFLAHYCRKLSLRVFNIACLCRILVAMAQLKFLVFEWTDLVVPRMLRLFDKASSLILTNIAIDILNDLDEAEVRHFWQIFPSAVRIY